jgi:uncharacterized protein GlcG (DUF336 family)
VVEWQEGGRAIYNQQSAFAPDREKPMYVASGKRLSVAGARKMIETAVGITERERVPISFAIVDAGGHLMLFERMDGGRFQTVHSSTTKAMCAASNKQRTSSLVHGSRGVAESCCPTPRSSGRVSARWACG